MIGTHWVTFRQIAPFFGRTVPARFIQRTHESIPGVQRIHNLIEGIYKPADSSHALAIASMLKNPYADRIEYNPDRTWFFFYSPKSGSLDSAVNRSLFNCMGSGEPVLVIKQLSDKTHAQGTRYKILGLGLIEEFDSKVPSTMEELITLPGVGRKTANVVLSNAFNKNAIAVDTHVVLGQITAVYQ